MMESQVVIDPTALQKLSQYGPAGFIARLVKMFTDNAPRQLDAVREAISTDDGSKIAFAAHAMKSSAGQVGATTLHRALMQIESCGKENRIEDARKIAQDLEDMLVITLELLQREAAKS